MNKKSLIDGIRKQLQHTLDQLQSDMENTRQALFNETKSSAGDKYETSREMIAQELEKLHQSIVNSRKKMEQLDQLENAKATASISNGSLIITDKAVFWLGIALGAIEVEGQAIMGISPNAPLASLFRGKKSGDRVQFLKREYLIKEVF
jgi:hypothetical protein